MLIIRFDASLDKVEHFMARADTRHLISRVRGTGSPEISDGLVQIIYVSKETAIKSNADENKEV